MNYLRYFFLWVFASFSQWKERKEASKAREASRLAAVGMGMNPPLTMEGPLLPHPKEKEHIDNCRKKIGRRKYFDIIVFSDSLAVFAQDELDWIEPRNNFGLPGSWSHHILSVAETLRPKIRQVSCILTGCGAGNPLLNFQEIEYTIAQLREYLDKMRELYPEAKLIVYGMPPVNHFHVMKHWQHIEYIMMEWVAFDSNSVFISFAELSTFFGLAPKARYNQDGIHLSPRGGYRFNIAVEKAIDAEPGEVIYA